MFSTYSGFSALLVSPVTLTVAGSLALAAVRPLIVLDDRLKRRKLLKTHQLY